VPRMNGRRKGGKAVVRRTDVARRTIEGNNYITKERFGSVREKGKKGKVGLCLLFIYKKQ